MDLAPQPRYPLSFLQMDALAFLRLVRDGWVPRPAAIHASPPCQAFTDYRRKGHGVGDGYPNLIPAVRELLRAIGVPYVIENVERAMSEMVDPVRVCGTSFQSLDVQRHRLFESNVALEGTACDHAARPPRYPGATNRAPLSRRTVEVGVWRIPLEVQQRAMGIDWMTLEELSEAIPPAYTEHVGRQLLAHLRAA